MKRFYLSAFVAGLLSPAVAAATATVPLPWHDDFEHHDNVGLIDSNNDYVGFGLNYNPTTGKFDSFVYDGREAIKDADDWMIFPWFHFEQGLKYTVTMRVMHTGESTADYECMLVKGDDDDDDLVVTSSAIKVGETWVVRPNAVDTWQEVSAELVSPVTGDYRFAYHFISTGRDKYCIDWITIGEGLSDASPAAPSTTTPTYKVVDNKLNVEFKITPPALTHLGADLPQQLSALIVRTAEGKASKEFTLDGLTPSTQATFVDPDGIGTGAEYAVHIMNGTSRGVKKSVSAKPTFGYPKAPANVVIKHAGANHFTATWDAVTAATSSSALFNPASVKYVAKLPDKTEVVLTMTDATAAEFDYPEPTESQVGAFINLYAVNERGESTAGKSNAVIIGPALKGAFAESFANAKFQNETWGLDPATGAWVLNGSGVTPHDADKGMVRYAQSAGKTGELISPTLDLSSMKRPFVRFWVYKKPASTLAATVDVAMRGYEEVDADVILFEAIDDHTLAADDATPSDNGWREYMAEVKLPADKLSRCNLVFKGTGANSYTYIYFDDITIADYPADTDIELSGITLPKKAEVGRKADVMLTVTNKGLTDIPAFKVKAMAGDRDLGEVEGGAIARFGAASVVFPFTPLPHESALDVPLTFVVDCEDDGDPDNNTATATLAVSRSLLPAVEDFAVAMTDDEAVLTWTAPQPGESGFAEVTEDFEEWADGALNGEFNGWKFIDIDGLPTKGYGSDDPAYKTILAAEVYSKGGAADSRGLYVPNCYGEGGLLYGKPDKWIILPAVAAGSTVKFTRLGFSVYGKSSAIELDYCSSKGGLEADDFDNVIASETINTKDLAAAAVKEFTLPANATRFAIHVKDCQAKAVGFDDFTYTTVVGAPVLLGYEIYCDGAMLDEALPEAVTYTHTFADTAEKSLARASALSHTYYVAAVYDQGRSGAGTIIEALTPAGIADGLATDATPVEYFTLQGIRVTGTPASGLYIRRQGTNITKIHLR